jgi:putative peptide zinc metalloprotease protein
MDSTVSSDLSWLTLPLALSPDAERLTGADGQSMVYVAASRRYIWLSAGAARLLDALDGETTAEAILAHLARRGDQAAGNHRRSQALEVIDRLRRAGVFTIASDATRRERPGRFRTWRPRSPRLRLTRHLEAVVARPTALLLRAPRLAAAGFAVLCIASVAISAACLVRFPARAQIVWPVVFAVLSLEVALHELGHAAACRAAGIRVREAGLMLWCGFLPLAYVDITDVYRLASKRARAAVALAGPGVDLLAAGASAIVVLTTAGVVRGTACTAFLSQLAILGRNLAPLPPADGYFALQAATGEVNLGRRSFSHLHGAARGLVCRLVRRAAPANAPLGRVGARRHGAYVAYAGCTLGYVAVLLGLAPIELHEVVRALG